MKGSKQVVSGLLGLILLLLAYGVLITVRASSLEKRLNRLEASYQELQARHRAFAITMLHADASPEAAARAKVDMLRESLALPTPTSGDVRQTGTKLNSPPQGVTSK
jgi:hypothetical protein